MNTVKTQVISNKRIEKVIYLSAFLINRYNLSINNKDCNKDYHLSIDLDDYSKGINNFNDYQEPVLFIDKMVNNKFGFKVDTKTLVQFSFNKEPMFNENIDKQLINVAFQINKLIQEAINKSSKLTNKIENELKNYQSMINGKLNKVMPKIKEYLSQYNNQFSVTYHKNNQYNLSYISISENVFIDGRQPKLANLSIFGWTANEIRNKSEQNIYNGLVKLTI